MIEVSTLAGLKDSAGLKRIDNYVRESIRTAHRYQCEEAERKNSTPPQPLTEDEEDRRFADHKKSIRQHGFPNWEFVNLAKRWPALERVMKECREEAE
jgi:hypothetical protein